MMPRESEQDLIPNLLAGLPDYEPDRRRAERIRANCHAALQTRRREKEAAAVPRGAPSWRLVLESAAIAAACLGYLAEVARRALLLYGL